MAQVKHPSKRPKGARGASGRALAIFVLGAWSFQAMAAPLPPPPGLQESQGVELVKSCYNKGPYTSRAEASVVADDAIDQGYTATVAKTSDGWMVKVCKK